MLGDGGAVRILVAACRSDPGGTLSALDTAARFGLVDAKELTRGRVAFPHTLTRALLTRALDDMPASPDDPGYVRALASLGRAMAFTGDCDRARAAGEQALKYARQLGDKRLLIHALQTMMWHAAAPHSLEHQLALAAELARLARNSGDWEGLSTATVFRATIAGGWPVRGRLRPRRRLPRVAGLGAGQRRISRAAVRAGACAESRVGVSGSPGRDPGSVGRPSALSRGPAAAIRGTAGRGPPAGGHYWAG